MKRVLIGFVAAGALLGQLGAVEIYKDGDKSFGIFGSARGVVGYGWNFDTTTTPGSRSEQNDILFGLQGNSRIGINFKLGKVFGAALLGVGESTMYGSNTNTGGFRQLYAGYDFGDSGKLLAGKNELVTSMGGFSSDIFGADNGLNGFGGASTSTRRFQIAYSVAGLTVSISENEFGTGNSYKKWQKSIPRVSLGYEYKDSSLRAKVAVSYAHKNATANNDGHKDMVLVTAGVKPTFDNQYVSVMLTYGLNANRVGETKIHTASLQRGFGTSVSNDYYSKFTTPSSGTTASTNPNTNTYAAMLEYGVNLADDLAFKFGAGYQYSSAWLGSEYSKLHSYAGFVQLPYKVGGGFSVIPQVGYLGTTKKVTGAASQNTGSVLALVQLNFTF